MTKKRKDQIWLGILGIVIVVGCLYDITFILTIIIISMLIFVLAFIFFALGR